MLEVLLSLAIIALLMTVLIGGSAALLKSRAVTPSEVFWNAVQECRKAALRSGKEVRLTYATKEKKFVISDETATPLQEIPVPAAGEDLTITFLTTQKGASAILIGGVLIETATLPAATFYSDGTCTAFRLQIQRGPELSTLNIDPWTCAAVLTPTDPNTL